MDEGVQQEEDCDDPQNCGDGIHDVNGAHDRDLAPFTARSHRANSAMAPST